MTEQVKFINTTVFEGMTSIRAIISNLVNNKPGARKIQKVYVDIDKTDSKEKEIAFLKRMGELFWFDVALVDAETINMFSNGNSHGGIIALCTDRNYKKLESNDIVSKGFYVMIDGIEDPYNFGYALRSIYASGADGIIVSDRNWLSAAGVVCCSSAGASEKLDVFVADKNYIDLFKEKGYKIVCADTKKAVSVYDADLKKPILLIVGGEKRGISSAILKQCDQVVRIDYGRKFDLSLSSSSAAAIISFEVFRNNLH